MALLRIERPLALARGPRHVYVAFAPSRTRIHAIAAKGARTVERSPSRPARWRLLHVGKATRTLRLDVDFDGEPPQVAAIATRAADDPDGDSTADAELEVAKLRRYAELLNDRAKRKFATHAAEHRFFLRFDAWTNPDLVEALREPDCVRRLTPAARRLFVSPRRAAFPLRDPAALNAVSMKLLGSVVAGAQALVASAPGARVLPPLQAGDPAVLEPFETYDAALAEIARYLKSIFDAGLPGGAGAAGAGARLEAAFSLFASGSLAFVPTTEKDPVRRALNAEPDSALFFVFAEFALRAAALSGEAAGYWLSLATIFVALEDVFLETYGSLVARHDASQYQRESRRSARSIDLATTRAHVERLRTACRESTLDTAEILRHVHWVNSLYAMRDEVLDRFRPEPSS